MELGGVAQLSVRAHEGPHKIVLADSVHLIHQALYEGEIKGQNPLIGRSG